MRDFLVKTSGQQVVSENELLLELFRVYKKHWRGVSFSRYHPWGKMLLKDFDEIDKQMVDAASLFTGINDLKEIEHMFKPDSEELAWLREFGTAFTVKEKSELQDSFRSTWEKLHPMYNEFREHLSNAGIAYEGMAYRSIADHLKDQSDVLTHSRYIFSGLYGLTRSEEAIIKHISEHRECRIFWDDDSYYVNDKDHEAGSYFRNSSLINEHPLSGNNNLESNKREIDVVSVPMNTLQGRYGGMMIGRMIDKGIEDRSAIVLADESLLPVLLNSIPDIDGEINVTMGYPLEGGMTDSFFRQLYNLHTFGTRRTGDRMAFHQRFVEEVMRNPAISTVDGQEMEYDRGIYLTSEQISKMYNSRESEIIFKELSSPADIFNYAGEIINLLMMMNDRRPAGGRLHRLSLEAVHSELDKLNAVVIPFISEIDTHTAWQMITEVIRSYRIPLSGEPVTGVQVMGFLETRALDFEHLVVMSLNDDKLPGRSHQNSFIPYSLRKTFGLHTRENRESMVAYNFYRLLQRAEHVTLIYDSGDPQSGGEMSRHLLQLIHEFGEQIPNTKIRRSTLSLELPPAKDRVIEIMKTEEIIEKVRSRIRERYLSPSALSTFLKCPLKYYFRYIEGIREPDNADGDIDNAQFGTILHEVMNELYTPFEGNFITVSDLKKIRKNTMNIITGVVEKVLGIRYSSLQGNNLLKAGAIKILAERIIDHDLTLAPFRIIALEKEIIISANTGEHDFRIGGKLDRIDEVKGRVRIVDYKTGRIELSSPDKIDRIFSNPKKDKLLQLYLYHLLYKDHHPDENVTAGFYEVRSISAGFREPDKNVFKDQGLMNEFWSHLNNTVTRLLDKDHSFCQTTDNELCKYCHYRDICHR
jgi:CRISPR/Cas system-associated exonuclease Cas4 (RecB family)